MSVTVTKVIMRPFTRVYPKVSGLAAWSENYKWYNSLPLGAVVLLFCESV
jgi:L-ribulose-5-phosphate 3-epimerase UlaE